jgi:hypothetical protein
MGKGELVPLGESEGNTEAPGLGEGVGVDEMLGLGGNEGVGEVLGLGKGGDAGELLGLGEDSGVGELLGLGDGEGEAAHAGDWPATSKLANRIPTSAPDTRRCARPVRLRLASTGLRLTMPLFATSAHRLIEAAVNRRSLARTMNSHDRPGLN